MQNSEEDAVTEIKHVDEDKKATTKNKYDESKKQKSENYKCIA